MKEIHQADSFKDKAQPVFGKNLLKQEMTSAPAPTDDRLSPNVLYYLAQGLPDAERAEKLEILLTRQPAARQTYRHIFDQISLFHFPQSMAAASGTLPVRNSQGCRIRLQESKAEPDQLYLIIEFSDGLETNPSKLTVFDSDDHSFGLNLAAPRNGIIQMIIERSEKIATLLTDPKSEAFLS